jgi:SAM-dependent methyltransferase
VDRRQVLATYDEEYARAYEERFIRNEYYRPKTAFELKILRKLLRDAETWLDVGCGTGYFLSRFPGVARAGLDLSPAMLEVAREANPDALFFRESDFAADVPEWQERWDLVTCMWYAYGLVESPGAVDRVIRNLAAWTSPRGACFVPICDPRNLAPGVRVPYLSRNVGFPPGTLLITSVTWTWIEDSGKRHQDMVAPAPERMIASFEEHFDRVELIRYPGRRWSRARLKAILARAKKPSPSDGVRSSAPARPGAVEAPAEETQAQREHGDR